PVVSTTCACAPATPSSMRRRTSSVLTILVGGYLRRRPLSTAPSHGPERGGRDVLWPVRAQRRRRQPRDARRIRRDVRASGVALLGKCLGAHVRSRVPSWRAGFFGRGTPLARSRTPHATRPPSNRAVARSGDLAADHRVNGGAVPGAG